MNLSDLTPEHRLLLDSTLAELVTAYNLDYREASLLLRTGVRETLRSGGTSTTDKRERKYTIMNMTIWDIRRGMDHAIEEAENTERELVSSLKGVANTIGEMLEGYFEYVGWEVPESCTYETLEARVPSFKTQLNRNDGDSAIRVYFKDPEGNQYLAIAHVVRGDHT